MLETEDLAHQVAQALVTLQASYPLLQVVFKGSFDKANRMALPAARGPGLDNGLELLHKVRQTYGLPVTSDIHESWQAAPAAQVCDILQIPAFLCRQTDLLVAAAKTGRIVNIKKGQFLAPEAMAYAVAKLQGSAGVWQTERGTMLGYDNLVVDMRSIPMMQRYGRPVLMDASHAVQRPGSEGGSSGGDRAFVYTLARAALAAGADGLFLETHPDPARALSDKKTQWPLAQLKPLVQACLQLWQCVRSLPALNVP
jgi:2-dehydro-3-deoxyphosphooctonate aldolase (KDO 8-P synthase)